MPEMKKYPPGAFCWVELATSDSGSAKAFYTGLFGWTVNDIPMGDQGTYHMFLKDGKQVGAMYQMGAQEKSAPPHWNNYVSVNSADECAGNVKKLGGSVVAGPFDVMDNGRMAAVTDAQGAAFALWQPAKTAGVSLFGETGALCWNELYTTDIVSARKFYSSLFGWKLKESPEYTEVHVAGNGIGGMMQITEEMRGMKPGWFPYFAVSDIKASVAEVKKLRGAVHLPPKDIPNVGTISMIADPQGASFFIIQVLMG
jgi:uncharacterized protein